MSWDDAEAFCKRKGGHLASVTSEDINAFVLQEKMLRNLEHLWIGGSDKENEGVWRWSDGSPWSYTNWDPGQPNRDNNKDCLQFGYHEKRDWMDRPCANNVNFVCSQALCSGGKSYFFLTKTVLSQIINAFTSCSTQIVHLKQMLVSLIQQTQL